MSIVKHQGSTNWYYTFQLNGRTYFKSTKTTNKALARKIEEKAKEHALREQTVGHDLEQITFGDALAGYIKSKEGTPFHRQLKTIIGPLRGHKRDHITKKMVRVQGIDFLKPLELLTTTELNRLVEARRREGSADATIKQHLVAVTGAIKWAKQMGYLTPIDIIIPKIKLAKPQPTFLTVDEEKALLQSLDPSQPRAGYGAASDRSQHRQQRLVDQYDFVVLLLDVGCRFNELATIKWQDVDIERGIAFIYQQKTQKNHTIYLTKRSIDVLVRRAADKSHATWVFPNDERTSHRPYSTAWFQRAVKRAGITKRFNMHKLRATFASRLVQSGVSLFEVQSLLGHQNPQTTMVYAGLVASDVSKKAVSVLNAVHQQH